MTKILVVDDERSIRKTFEIFLTKENHTVYLAENAEEALRIIESNDLDLIFTDIIMPKTTGIELLAYVKENYPDLPIVIMTGEPTISTARKAVEGSAFDYLIKPINKYELLKTVENALQKKELIDSKKELEEKNRLYRKKLEEHLKERTEALETTQKVLDLSPIPTFIMDTRKDALISANKAMLGFMNEKSFEKLNHNTFFETSDENKNLMTQYYEKEKFDQVEVQIKKGTGELVWCLLSLRHIKLAGKQLTIISFTDVNEIVETKRHLEEAKQKAEETTKMKSKFLANMSHEIRTPMNAIIGLGSLLNSAELTPKHKTYLDKLNISTKNLMDIINDILDFSKLESGKLNIEHTEFSIKDTLDNVVTVISFSVNDKKLNLLIDNIDDLPERLIGDSLRLGQVLLNLSNNAVKFTDKGSVTLEVKRLHETDKNIQLRFSVHDTGIGITENNKEKLFTSFTQADNSITRKYGGSGLGLVISKSLVELMGGEIGFESKYGEGSTVFFNITFEKVNDKSAPSAEFGNLEKELNYDRKTKPTIPENLNDDNTVTNKNSIKILLVEDNEINQLVTEEMLKMIGYSTDVAENGEVAVTKVLNNAYDLILMDLQMPVMDGYIATKKIREHNIDIPIIALSADSLGEVEKKTHDTSMNDYLSKPINMANLEIMLSKWLR